MGIFHRYLLANINNEHIKPKHSIHFILSFKEFKRISCILNQSYLYYALYALIILPELFFLIN